MFEPEPDNTNLTPSEQEVPESTDQNPVDAAVGMEARQMLKGIDLPADGKIPEALRRQVVETVTAHIKHYRITHRAVGAQIGIGGPTLSEVFHNRYKGDTDTILRKLNAWIDDDERRRRREAPLGLYETSVFLAVRDAAAIAKKNARTSDTPAVNDERARIVIASGPSGCGKSVAAKALYASDPNAILIRLRQRSGTDMGIINSIIESAGWRGKPTKTRLIDFVFEKLRHSGRLLIVDQGHKLSHSGYEILLDLADECGIPILVIGTELIRRKVVRVRMGAGDIQNDQFARRVAYQMDLLRGSDGQGGNTRPFFTLEEVMGVFKSDKVRLTIEGAEFLQAIACMIGMGMLGQAANIYEKAQYAALRRPDKLIDLNLLWSAAQRVIMEPGITEGWDQIERQIQRLMDANRQLEIENKASRKRKTAVAG